jgi:hypothetical protein
LWVSHADMMMAPLAPRFLWLKSTSVIPTSRAAGSGVAFLPPRNPPRLNVSPPKISFNSAPLSRMALARAMAPTNLW